MFQAIIQQKFSKIFGQYFDKERPDKLEILRNSKMNLNKGKQKRTNKPRSIKEEYFIR